MPRAAAQGRYVNPTNACQSFQPHPSTFAFSGFEGAQSRYVNPTNACQSFLPHPSTFAFSGFEGAKRHRLCRPCKWQPVGPESCWGSAVSDACSPATLGAVTCLWSGWCPTCCPGPLRQPNQCLPKLPAPPIHLCF